MTSKYDMITKGLVEIIGNDELKTKLLNDKPLKIYWGTSTTGQIHIGYLYPMKKIADFLKAGCEVTILLADLHAFLDNAKSPLEKINQRAKYYEEIIKSTLEVFGVDISKVKFVLGSSFQLKPEYVMDLFKLGNITTIKNAQKAGSEVVKQSDNPLLTSLLYPLMQSLDEHYLDVDIQFAGNDQRKLLMYAREFMPAIGYSKRIYLLNPIISGISTVPTNGVASKMSSSDSNGKIELLNTPKQIKNKINKAYCLEGNILDNSLLDLTKNLLFPILLDMNKNFVINRPEKYGGILLYKDYTTIEDDFQNKKLHPSDLKLGIADILIELTEPIRQKFNSKEMQDLMKKAYD
jgi:tyrosyl-tRNA synthetase